MSNSNPFFSVIVVSLNAEKTILKTIESVLNQTIDDYEIIVKDGCSKDCTVTLLPKNNKISVYIMADKSVYDAMNQATELAKGKYVIYLNCGDTLVDSAVLEKVKAFLINKTETGIAYGDYVRDDLGLIRQKQITKAFDLIRKPLCHQSMFFRRDLLVGKQTYSLDYKISADYDLTTRLFNQGCQMNYMGFPVCTYEGGGISEQNNERVLSEAAAIRRQNFDKKTRIIHGLYNIATISSLRFWIVSNQSPKWLRELFVKMRDRLG